MAAVLLFSFVADKLSLCPICIWNLFDSYPYQYDNATMHKGPLAVGDDGITVIALSFDVVTSNRKLISTS